MVFQIVQIDCQLIGGCMLLIVIARQLFLNRFSPLLSTLGLEEKKLPNVHIVHCGQDPMKRHPCEGRVMQGVDVTGAVCVQLPPHPPQGALHLCGHPHPQTWFQVVWILVHHV